MSGKIARSSIKMSLLQKSEHREMREGGEREKKFKKKMKNKR